MCITREAMRICHTTTERYETMAAVADTYRIRRRVKRARCVDGSCSSMDNLFNHNYNPI